MENKMKICSSIIIGAVIIAMSTVITQCTKSITNESITKITISSKFAEQGLEQCPASEYSTIIIWVKDCKEYIKANKNKK